MNLRKISMMIVMAVICGLANTNVFAADVDKTSLVGTSRDAWNATGGPVNIDGIFMPEKYETTTTPTGDVLWQTVTGLDNGTYTVELYANARYTPGRGFESVATDGEMERTFLFANDVELSIPVYHNPDLNNGLSFKLENVQVTDGTLRMGMTKKAEGSNWHTIQIKSLTWHATDDAELVSAKDALSVAISEAYAVDPATPELTAAIDAAESVLENSTVVDDINAATATLKTATTIAINTNSVAGATTESPVVTNFVANGTFDSNGVVSPWKTTTGAQNQTTANNQQGAFTGNFYENWNPNPYSGKIYQTINNIPNGVYELSICAFVSTFGNGTNQYVYANDSKTYLTTGTPTEYKVVFEITNNTVEIGFAQTEAINTWSGIDNVYLTYYGTEATVDEVLLGQVYKKQLDELRAKATGLLDEGISTAAANTINQALAATENVENTSTAYDKAIAMLNNAISTAEASKTSRVAIDNMYDLMNSTNVYTKEAYDTYKAAADAYFEKWDAGTLTETVVNPYKVQDWHFTNDYDDFLLSAWGTKDFDTNLYINTWSVEGENDGSNFKVPFFEYWTGDDQSLGETTKTATVTGLEAGRKYVVSAWVRVRMKNGATAPTYGITLSSGANGTPVDVAAGINVPNSPFYIGEYKVVGVADAEGNLTINFNIAADNNISWLSFKNVKYAELSTGKNLDFSESTPIDNHICTYAKDMETNGTTYSQMQPVTSWDMAVENGDARAAGVFAYGGTPWIGGAGYTAPATNPEGVAEGNALGMVGVWTGTVQYTQKVTFEPGNYVITIPIYNSGAGKNDFVKNLIGFIAEDGTEYLASAKTYPSNTWTTETITFTLDKLTNGVLSLGYQAPNAGNGSQHHLFIDCVKIKVVTDLDLAKEELLADIKDAKATVEAKAGVGEGLFLIPTSALDTYVAAVEAAQSVYDNATTVADVETAIATLATATEAYAASVTLPEAEKKYLIRHNASNLFMTLDGGVKITESATVKFVNAGNGKYYIANALGEYAYYSGTGNNTWSMGISAEKMEAWTITAVGEGLYTIKGKNGFIGTDATTDGAACYGNKGGDVANSMWVIYEATTISVTMNISDAKYSTFIAPFEVTIPDGVTASKVAGATDGVLTLEDLEGTIPANTPVVLYSETAYNSTLAGIDLSTKDSYTDGLLTGVYTATTAEEGWYVLQNNNGKVKFYLVGDVKPTVGANRCYLTVPAESAGVKAFSFGRGDATGISAIEALQNGDAEIYTINGTRVNTLQKGINIVKMSNGKTQKVLVK